MAERLQEMLKSPSSGKGEKKRDSRLDDEGTKHILDDDDWEAKVANMQKCDLQFADENDEETSPTRPSPSTPGRPSTRRLPHTTFKAEYLKLGAIGKGAQGEVFRAQRRSTGVMHAVKKIEMKFYHRRGVEELALREIQALTELRHPNIVRFVEVFVKGAHLYLVFEKMRMDLHSYFSMQWRRGSTYDPAIVQSLSFQILQGLLFCHKRGIIHRDLKPENILLSQNLRIVKVADFGLAKMKRAAEVENALTPKVGTLIYQAPELLFGSDKYGAAVDVWSAACIIVELFRLHPLFEGRSMIEVVDEIFSILPTPTKQTWPGMVMLSRFYRMEPHSLSKSKEGQLKKAIGVEIPSKALGMIKAMLAYDPTRRLTIRQACRHSYFDDLNKKELPAPVED